MTVSFSIVAELEQEINVIVKLLCVVDILTSPSEHNLLLNVLWPTLSMSYSFCCFGIILQFVQSTFRNIVTDELKRVLGSSTSVTKSSDKDAPPEEHDAEMLWNYETMTARSPTELPKEDYVELMVAMERALYDDLLAEMRAQGTTVFSLAPQHRSIPRCVGMRKFWRRC